MKKQETILITGGCGYIGSHTAFLLHSLGFQTIIIDSLVHQQTTIPTWTKVINADFANQAILEEIFTQYNISAVIHFAALIEVGESVKRPSDFYQNNVTKTLVLLETMRKHKIKKFIFSSSCAVYGIPATIPIDEQQPFAPTSPYGKNKATVEYMLQDFSAAYDLAYISLRYFNAAGAAPEYGLGEQHQPETHIIPLLLRAGLTQKPFYIFGNDYPTQDGTCIRDYVHVLDIAQAHVLACKYLWQTNTSNSFNLGSEAGYSVTQLITAAEKYCGLSFNIVNQGRRRGDVPMLVANSTKARQILGWKPEHSSLQNILTSAFGWEQSRSFISVKKESYDQNVKTNHQK